jgi:hypothetical protein
LIHKLLLAAVLGLGLTSLAFARPPARYFQRSVSIGDIRVSSSSRIVYRPGTSRMCSGQGSCTVYPTRIDRSRFSQYYRFRR